MNRNNILVVVDYQKDFVDGALGFEKAKQLDIELAKKIKHHWDEDGTVIFTFDTHHTDYMNTIEGENLPVPHCIVGTPGWELYGNVNRVHNWGATNNKPYYDINKMTFGSTDLIDVFNKIVEEADGERHVTVEFTGVVTNICVISNAIIAKATVPNARIIINSSLCGSNDRELEQKAFDIMKNLHMEII